MSIDHRQRRRRFPTRFWIFVFKATIAVGQVAILVSKLFSLRE